MGAQQTFGVLAALSVALSGCAREPKVVRAYRGTQVSGRFIAPEAYAEFLRGALAEASGQPQEALAAYARAAAEDNDPEVHVRLGALHCVYAASVRPRESAAAQAHERAANRAFARALSQDSESVSALAAKAECELTREHAEEALGLSRRAFALEPTNAHVAALVLRAESALRPSPGPSPGAAPTRAAPRDAQVRAQALALTREHAWNAAVWEALLGWAYARRDPELVATAFAGLVRADLARSRDAERGVIALANDGHLPLARQLAASIADIPRDRAPQGPHDPAVARLAIDEAVLRNDENCARLRAIRGHVPLKEVAERARALGNNVLGEVFLRETGDAVPASEAVPSGEPG